MALHSLVLLALPFLAQADVVTFMFPEQAPVMSAAVNTVSDSTTIYELKCFNEYALDARCPETPWSYTIMDSQHFAYDQVYTYAFPTYTTINGVRSSWTVNYSESQSATCSITSKGALCTSMSIDASSTIGKDGPSEVSTYSIKPAYQTFYEFVIDVPTTGSATAFATLLSSPAVGNAAIASATATQTGSGTGAAATGTPNTNGTITPTGTAKPADSTNAANRNAAGALVGAAALVMAAL
jgi:hypothetical protein